MICKRASECKVEEGYCTHKLKHEKTINCKDGYCVKYVSPDGSNREVADAVCVNCLDEVPSQVRPHYRPPSPF